MASGASNLGANGERQHDLGRTSGPSAVSIRHPPSAVERAGIAGRSRRRRVEAL